MIKRIVQKIKNKKIGKNTIIFYLPDEKKSRLRAFARTRAKNLGRYLMSTYIYNMNLIYNTFFIYKLFNRDHPLDFKINMNLFSNM